MGMNYYWYSKPKCECCGREYESLHIGKSSYGWCFSLHILPEEEINSLNDWRERWARPNTYILDENHEPISIAKMEACITQRRPGFWCKEQPLRHKIDYRHCVAHGEGTWDYITGVFS